MRQDVGRHGAMQVPPTDTHRRGQGLLQPGGFNSRRRPAVCRCPGYMHRVGVLLHRGRDEPLRVLERVVPLYTFDPCTLHLAFIYP
jgi:hypothetical protein